jgi:exopolysaccharide biosynthesis polyprenyl glycosylphosphotransferase
MRVQDKNHRSVYRPILPELNSRTPIYNSEDETRNPRDSVKVASPVQYDTAARGLSHSEFCGRAVIFISSQLGVALTSLACLWLSVYLHPGELPTAELVAGLLIIRAIHNVTGPAHPLFSSGIARTSVQRVVRDELLVTIFLIAASTIMVWRIDRQYLALFAGLNLAAQVGHFYLTKFLSQHMKRSGNAGLPAHNTQALIIGTGHTAQLVADSILQQHLPGVAIHGFLDYHRSDLWRYRDMPLMGHPDSLRKIIAQNHIDLIIIAVESADLALTKPVFRIAEKMGVTIASLPDTYQPALARASAAHIVGIPALLYRSAPHHSPMLFLKDFIDRLGALAGLAITSPITILTALAIKFESRGPIFFKQRRTGRNGKTFMMLKFRTMTIDAEKKKDALQSANEMTGPVFKIKDDPRVTKVGKFLRKYSIDEIPQFWNVLMGDMSLVGPRPPLPKEVVRYEPWQHRRLSVKPGLTCLWQVNGRNQIDFEEWMFLDLEYIDNWSLWGDMKILAKTLPTVVRGTGT